MRKLFLMSLLMLLILSSWDGLAMASWLVLNGEYSVEASAANISGNSWRFTYKITNINQGVSSSYGLDGFAIQIPNSATVTSYTVPAPYWGAPGYWSAREAADSGELLELGDAPSDPGYHWMLWSGFHQPSVYPIGSTATFSVTLDNVSVGTNEAGLVTFWATYKPPIYYITLSGANYTPYLTNLPSPVAFVSITPSSHDFGIKAIGWSSTQQFSVTNMLNENLAIGTLSLIGTNASEFIIQNDNCSGATLAPQETRTFDVVFTAASLGSKSAMVSIPITSPSVDPVTISLTALVTPICECDLNHDTRCDMSDWLLFGQRWGATNCNTVPCACDLNTDGRCDMRDWLLFGRNWGRTNCPIP